MSETWEQLADTEKKETTKPNPTAQPLSEIDISAAVASIVNSMPQFSLDSSLPKLTPLSKTKIEKKEKKQEDKKQEGPKPEQKKEPVKKKPVKVDNREHLNIVFIGHVDAGKSTLGGRILYSMGYVDERTIEKYEREAKEKNRESWFLAYVLDCEEEERERGKTVEVARAHFETKSKRYTILDAPGHRSYVPNMIGGAAQADVAVLVISARKGEFETGFEKDGQTREHTTLAKTLGIRRLVVVINKMDDPTVNWSKERYDEIVSKLQPFITKQVGFDKKYVTFLPVSAFTGHGVVDRIPKEVCPWNTSGSLIEVLDGLHLDRKNVDGPLRIPIIDKYKDMGVTVAIGKIESGKVQVGDIVTVMPNKVSVEVLKITLHEDEVDLAKCGDNVNLYLKGIEADDIKMGYVICDPNNLCQPVQEFMGQFLVLDMPIFSAGYSPVLHIHTAVVECTITRLLNKIDKKTGKPLPNKINFAKTGDIITAVIKCARPICIEKFDVLQSLGRFTLREGRTVGIGKVTAIKPLKAVEKDTTQKKKQ